MTGEGIKKKRDPIFSVCFVVFVVACVGVVGVFVDEHYIQQDDTKVAYGDKVEVNYIGSYYAYYDEQGAVVFDTSLSSIGNDDKYLKAYDFSKSSYDTFDVTVGSGKALKMFEDSLIGHKVGDKIQVMIPAGQGYLAPAGTSVTESTNITVDLVQTMTKAQFDDIYEDVKLVAGQSATITSAYGWPATAYYDVTDNKVVITNMPQANQTYDYIGNEDSEFGKVSYQVTAVGDSISAKISFTDTVSVADGIQMLQVNVDGTPVYITAVSGDTYTYKTCEEKCNIDLYFEIEIVSIGA